MFPIVVATALALTQAASLRVPYVPQTDALCGGAAAAMVFRYWGDAHAGAAQFTALVQRGPGGSVGIADDVLAGAIRGEGWRTERAGDSIDGLRARIDARPPVIVLLVDRR